jgi:hypothetical protein
MNLNFNEERGWFLSHPNEDVPRNTRTWRLNLPPTTFQPLYAREIFLTFQSNYRVETRTGCWTWIGNFENQRGQLYPVLKMKAGGRSTFRARARRVAIAYHLNTLPESIPATMIVPVPKCGNDLCVSPHHLEPMGHRPSRINLSDQGVTVTATPEKPFREVIMEEMSKAEHFSMAEDILKTSAGATPETTETNLEDLWKAVQLTPEQIAEKEERRRQADDPQEKLKAEAQLELARREARARKREISKFLDQQDATTKQPKHVSIKDLISEAENETKQQMKEIDEHNKAIRKQVEDLANGAPLPPEGVELATDLLSEVDKKETGE